MMNNHNNRKRSFYLVQAILILLLASAALGQTLGLAPAEVKATFIPGQAIQFDLGVSNDGPDPVVMRAAVNDFWYNQKSEKVFGPPGTLPRSASNWRSAQPPCSRSSGDHHAAL